MVTDVGTTGYIHTRYQFTGNKTSHWQQQRTSVKGFVGSVKLWGTGY